MENKMAYVGRCQCGQIVAAAVDNPEHRADVIAFVRECMEQGLDVERLAVETVRSQFGTCTCAVLHQQTLLEENHD